MLLVHPSFLHSKIIPTNVSQSQSRNNYFLLQTRQRTSKEVVKRFDKKASETITLYQHNSRPPYHRSKSLINLHTVNTSPYHDTNQIKYDWSSVPHDINFKQTKFLNHE